MEVWLAAERKEYIDPSDLVLKKFLGASLTLLMADPEQDPVLRENAEEVSYLGAAAGRWRGGSLSLAARDGADITSVIAKAVLVYIAISTAPTAEDRSDFEAATTRLKLLLGEQGICTDATHTIEHAFALLQELSRKYPCSD